MAALKKVEEYDSGAPADISIAGMMAVATQLDGLNQLVAGKEQALTAFRTPRKAAYDGEGGLKEKMLAIKEARGRPITETRRAPSSSSIKGVRV